MSWPTVSAVTGGRGGVRLKREGQLARMVLSNPGARNAMSLPMMADFLAAVTDLMADPPIALIVVGDGADGFCAGGDLRDVRAHLMDDGSAEAMSSAMGRATAQLAASPMVIVSAVEGAALGGGAELSQLADWVVMAESARIGFVHARLGVSPGWGGASLLFRRVGRSAAAAILLRAEVHGAESALTLGLADQVTADGEALAQAEAWLAPILTAPPDAIRGALRLVREGATSEAVGPEREIFCSLWGGEAHRAALDRSGAGK